MGATAGHGGPADLAAGRLWDGSRWVGDDHPEADGPERIAGEGRAGAGSAGRQRGSKLDVLAGRVGLGAVLVVLVLATVACPPLSADRLSSWLILAVGGLLLVAFPTYDAVRHWPARLYLAWTAGWFAYASSLPSCDMGGYVDQDCVAFQIAGVLIGWFLGAAVLAVCRLISWGWWPPEEVRG
jgi:hypothetical protein